MPPKLFFLALLLPTLCTAFTKLTILSLPLKSWTPEGHSAVNASLRRGLTALGVPFNFNPATMAECGDVVMVPANIPVLRQALKLKKMGVIKYLLAGPNLVVLPTECSGILADEGIDCCIVPSESVKLLYEQVCPALRGRIAVWPAGVDTSFWYPSTTQSTSKTVLVYKKNAPEKLCAQAEQLLRKHGWQPQRITYGNYDRHDYRAALHNARFALFFSRTESQGIALAECWSCNVPTLVWDPQQPVAIGSTTWWPVHAAPYLTPATGYNWASIAELENLLINIREILPTTAPHRWVEEHMSDAASAQLLVDIIKQIE